MAAALSSPAEWSARLPGPELRARPPPPDDGARRMSYQPAEPVERHGPRESVAGFLAALSIFASLFALAYRPVRIIPFALILAFIATGIGGRHQGLATFAVFLASGCFVAAMVIAIATGHPLF